MFRIEYNDQVKRKIKLVSNNVEFALFPSNVKATKKKKTFRNMISTEDHNESFL